MVVASLDDLSQISRDTTTIYRYCIAGKGVLGMCK